MYNKTNIIPLGVITNEQEANTIEIEKGEINMFSICEESNHKY